MILHGPWISLPATGGAWVASDEYAHCGNNFFLPDRGCLAGALEQPPHGQFRRRKRCGSTSLLSVRRTRGEIRRRPCRTRRSPRRTLCTVARPSNCRQGHAGRAIRRRGTCRSNPPTACVRTRCGRAPLLAPPGRPPPRGRRTQRRSTSQRRRRARGAVQRSGCSISSPPSSTSGLRARWRAARRPPAYRGARRRGAASVL